MQHLAAQDMLAFGHARPVAASAVVFARRDTAGPRRDPMKDGPIEGVIGGEAGGQIHDRSIGAARRAVIRISMENTPWTN